MFAFVEINERNIDIKLKKSLTKCKLKLESNKHYIVLLLFYTKML